jgi:tRNA wybutosine-synthesizing protein 3
MTFNFNNSKKMALMKKDKSDKESWDKPIVSLCEKINKKEDYFTTSSCSGRIVLLKESVKKLPNLFIYRTHNKITFKELKKILANAGKEKEMIYFKQEPCLVVVSCKNLEKQQNLLNKARESGFGKSGIISTKNKRIVELMGSEIISLPIMKKGDVLVDDDYLKLLVKESNFRLENGWKKIEKLEKEFF